MTTRASIKEKKRIIYVKNKYKILKKSQMSNNVYSISDIELLYFKPCIYKLMFNNVVVYIGETTSLMNRISQHINENTKIFDSFSFSVFVGSNAQRKSLEASLIRKIKPIYNITHIKENKIKIVNWNCGESI